MLELSRGCNPAPRGANEDAASVSNTLDHLVQERAGIRRTPCQDVGRTQDRGDLREEDLEVGALTERQAAFERGDCLVKLALAAIEQPDPSQSGGDAVGLVDHLREPYRVLCHAASLGEAAQFGQTPRAWTPEPTAGRLT